MARRGRGIAVRVGALIAMAAVFALAGCAQPGSESPAPAKRVAQREASSVASISASDAALLRALESTLSFIDLREKAELRAAELEAELRSVRFVAETTLTLPGELGTGTHEGFIAGRSGSFHAAAEFDRALTGLSPVTYFKATGLIATIGQLRTFRDALQGVRSGESTPVPEALANLDATLRSLRPCAEHTLRLSSSRDGSVERWVRLTEAPGEPVYFWLRTQKRGKLWYVTAAGRDASWASGAYAGKVSAYAGLRDWITARGEKDYAKPVIYLYPSREQSVTVRFDQRTILTSTSPVIDSATKGWTVRAKPDGTLTDASGRRWPYLFWEGVGAPAWDLTTGSVIRGADADAYLRRALAERGLSAAEGAEFREYWVPRLSVSPWVLVHWEGAAYEASVPLRVTPRPDVSLRVFMVAKPLDAPVAVTPQRLVPPPERRGFTLVEWGGTILP